jgi:hypothetical protein
VAGNERAGIEAQVSAARSWGQLLYDVGRFDDALEGYDTMIALMPNVAPVGLADADRMRRVERWEGLAGRAIGCAIAAGHPERAVELLERTRMVTAPAIRVAAADLEALRRRRPDLAAAVDARHEDLARATPGNDVSFMPVGITLVTDGMHDRRGRLEAAARAWHDTVAQVRKVPEFSRFLMPARFDDLRQAAGAVPVAIPIVSTSRCDVLLITVDGVDVLPLPVTEDEVIDWANRYVRVLMDINEGTPSLARRTAVEDELGQILAWLWDGTVAPTLDALGFSDRVGGDEWPHLRWSGAGVFSLFPLHAAGSTPEDGAMDRVRSSYAPSLRLLAHLQAEASDPGVAQNPPRLLAVGLSNTP